MTARVRAPRVCSNCKSRKRACDKILPCCGYCLEHDLDCNYDPLLVDHGKPIIVGGLSELSSCTSEAAVASMLNLQVCNLIQRTGRGIKATSERYLKGVNQWLPLLCPGSIGDIVKRSEHAVAPCEISLLILAMYLITESESETAVSSTDLYFVLKIYLQHAASFGPNTLRFVQAGVLLTVYEYATSRFGSAYISLGLIARLADILDLPSTTTSTNMHSEHASPFFMESVNTWWSILVVERLIRIESPTQRRTLCTALPTGEVILPSDLQTPHNSTACQNSDAWSPGTPRVSCFGRSVQAIYLLEPLLDFIGDTNRPPDLTRLERFDKEFQTELRRAFERGVHELHIDAAALIGRGLLLVHAAILSHPDIISGSDRPDLKQSSEVAQETLMRMVLAAVHHHEIDLWPISQIPPFPIYNLRVALDFIRKRPHLITDEAATGVRAATAFDTAYRAKWR